MLAVARVNLERAGLANCIVRLGDMYQLPLADASFDAVVIHQVLHYADRPAAAIAEAARVLRPGGGLIVVDFAPHALEFLRDEHAHRRLGFADADVAEWCRAAGLEPGQPQSPAGRSADGGDLDGPAPAGRGRRFAATARSAAVSHACRASSSGMKQMHSTAGAASRGLLAADPVSDFDAGSAAHLVRVLPAENGGNGRAAVGRDQAAGAAAAALCVRDLRRRRLDPRAHPRDGAAHPRRNRCSSRRRT